MTILQEPPPEVTPEAPDQPPTSPDLDALARDLDRIARQVVRSNREVLRIRQELEDVEAQHDRITDDYIRAKDALIRRMLEEVTIPDVLTWHYGHKALWSGRLAGRMHVLCPNDHRDPPKGADDAAQKVLLTVLDEEGGRP